MVARQGKSGGSKPGGNGSGGRVAASSAGQSGGRDGAGKGSNAAGDGAGAPATRVAAGSAQVKRKADAVQEFFSIGEVCALTGLKPHVLRYWESQLRVLSPAKNRSGNRVYQRREVELVMLVKQLLYEEKYTLDGARQKLGELRRAKTLRSEASGAFRTRLASEIELELRDILDLLETEDTDPQD